MALEEEEDWDGEYEEEEDEDDLAAYAEQAKRAIEEQLFSTGTDTQPPVPPTLPPNPKEQAAVLTVRAILASLEHDSLAQSALTASKVPEFPGDSLLDILRNIAGSGKIPRGVALPISRSLVTLAKSEALFGSLRHSDASSLQLKRKREEAEEGERAHKRMRISTHSLHVELTEAVRAITNTFTISPTLGPTVISSIQPQLHRVFLFAVSSSAVPGPNTTVLQEIGGLIQVLGVLGGTQITQESQNILTTVYPCLIGGCGKFFARVVSLRAHQPIHSSWKCTGCDQLFPRRDAINKHKTSGQPKADCVSAEIVEVPPFAEADNAKALPKNRDCEEAEEGELELDMISEIQAIVMGLHVPLQTHVARALGAASGQATSGAANGQATLASVVAQAQRATTGAPATDASSVATNVSATASSSAPAPPAATVSGLSDEQTKQLNEAISNAASAAHAEAEAQEDEEDDDTHADAGSVQPPA
ncbi:hypothetical protein C8R45DRAFT_821091 [Mycena sanguinolenta]|nr:hypothetical protein C8R45DRAFT_821091 [Mycena sanguinolenta]